MSTPKITEIQRGSAHHETVVQDDFLDDIDRKVTRPSPRSRGFVELLNGARKKSIGPTS